MERWWPRMTMAMALAVSVAAASAMALIHGRVSPGSVDRDAMLDHHLAAIRRQRGAGDEARLVGGEKDHAARDVLGLAQPRHRDLRDDVLLQHVLRHRLHHLGVDVARTDGVHRDAAA